MGARAQVLRFTLFAALVVAIGYVCYGLGQRGAQAYERMQIARITNGLAVLGMSWARVEADGLRIELHGHAPDLFARELALESARATASLARIQNYATATLAPPERREPVHIELLRDSNGVVTLTGQTTGREMRRRLNAALAGTGPELEVRDLTGIQAAQPPASWGPEIEIAALAASGLPNAYVVVEPGHVSVKGNTADAETRGALSTKLGNLAGSTVTLDLDIDIPPRVIAPFGFAAIKEPGEPLLLEACAARNSEEQLAILAAFTGYGGAPSGALCPVGLGGPDVDWGGGVAAALAALDALPAGRIDVEYRSIRLMGMPPTPPPLFDKVAATFRADVPEGFEAEASLLSEDVATRVGLGRDRYWLRLAKGPDGITIAGEVRDATSGTAIHTYAAALFGADRVHVNLIETGRPPPEAWQTAALQFLDALRDVQDGAGQLAGTRAVFRGTVDEPGVAAAIHASLARDLSSYEVETALRVDLASAMAQIALPGPACATALRLVIAERPIDFDTGSAVITEETQPLLDQLAETFHRCASGTIEVGGHTDSHGSEDLNQRLSTARAEAVVTALVNRGVPPDRMAAQGYGESAPVADNASKAGRARNRRIEFRAVPAGADTAPPPAE